MSFVHLHVHSEYSLLDGMSRIPELVQRAAELDMPALALTDHGTMFGAINFYREAKKHGVKPLIGVEAYLSRRGMTDRDPKLDSRAYHLLLLAENDEGYRNLLKLSSAAQLVGFYYRPRIDHAFLADHSEGLICTTGCMSGEIPRAIARGDLPRVESLLDWYFEVFGKDRFFFELQHHEIPELTQVNQSLVDLAKRYDARFVATNDVHYVRPEDAELQDILLCIQTGALRSDPDRMKMTDPSYYLRSGQEMRALFGEIPGAIDNTLSIAERCEVNLEFEGYHLPDFQVPPNHTPDSYLRELCEAGLAKRYGPHGSEPKIRERLKYELGIIHAMGFDTYFLIVWDLCRYAREQSIWYNARGSAAGSIVAYCLEITLVDPLEHGLIFERFLNPGRVSMPDIDLDFQDDQRYRMLEYTTQKYGEDKVAQIITFGTLGARAAIRDVGRVLDIPLPEVDRVAKLVPHIPGKPISIPEALESISAFQDVYSSEPYLKELVDTAAQLEGISRNAGTHAAGVIITDRPLTEYVPLHRPTSGAQEDNPIRAVTQFDMQVLDSLGLLKVDFLGLSTLTVMARACELIRIRHGVELDIHTIPLDDPLTYQLLGSGDVLGVFQVEGVGMRRYLMEMKPQKLAHVIAMVALYRPGPMDFIPAYIRRMHGEEQVSFRHPSLSTILEETYGITVYQEQIMYTAMELAGYSASEADNLRKAVAKKKARALKKQRESFVQGAVKKNVAAETANAIFDDWEAFARYGFPKGHAADYAVICVETAYLKAHYPIEYMAALLSVFKHDTDKVALYIADCRRMGIEVLPPDVNYSGLDFEIEDRGEELAAIRYGLGAIKNVGDSAVDVILCKREDKGPFLSLERLAKRVDLRQVGKRAVESLIRVGALDRFGERLTLLEALDRIMSFSATHFRAADVGQMTFFSSATGISEGLALPESPREIPRRTLLSWEKDLLGLYVSDHPLAPYMEELRDTISHYSADLNEGIDGETVTLAGAVTAIRPYQTRTGKPMGFVTLEDLQGNIELVVFSRVWTEISTWLERDKVVVVQGRVDAERGTPKILVDRMTTDLQSKVGSDSKATPQPLPAENELPPAPPEREMMDRTAMKSDPPESTAPMVSEKLLEVYAAASPPSQRSDLPAESGEGSPDSAAANPRSGLRLPSQSSPNARLQPGNPEVPLREAGLIPSTPSEASQEAEILPELERDSAVWVVTIIFRSTGDQERDARRMRRVHGLMNSYPGRDRFVFHVFEAARRYHLEFPNSTTDFTPELHAKLLSLLGEEGIRVERVRVQ